MTSETLHESSASRPTQPSTTHHVIGRCGRDLGGRDHVINPDVDRARRAKHQDLLGSRVRGRRHVGRTFEVLGFQRRGPTLTTMRVTDVNASPKQSSFRRNSSLVSRRHEPTWSRPQSHWGTTVSVAVAGRGFYLHPARVVITLTAVRKLADATTQTTGATMRENNAYVAAAMAITTRLSPALRSRGAISRSHPL